LGLQSNGEYRLTFATDGTLRGKKVNHRSIMNMERTVVEDHHMAELAADYAKARVGPIGL
jgi:hypothetical protein